MISFGVDPGSPIGVAQLPPAAPTLVAYAANLLPADYRPDYSNVAGDLPPASGLVGLDATLPLFVFRPGDPTGAALGIGNAGGGGGGVGLLVTVALLALLLYLASRKW